MASPQTEDGYARVATELADAFSRYPLSGKEGQVIWYVVRNIYGWKGRKETPPVSVRPMGLQMRMHPSTVSWVLRGLIARGIIFRTPNGGLRLNKNYDEWLPRRVSGQLPLKSAAKVPAPRPGDAPPPAAPGRKKRGAAAPAFLPPSLADVQAYALERKSAVDPAKFFHRYESMGWKSGGQPMTNWKSAFCYWERTEFPATRKGKASGPPCPICSEPKASETAICCDSCRAFCRSCGLETAQLRVVVRPDKTKTLQCKGKCRKPDPEVARLAHVAVPTATEKLEAEKKHEQFMAEHRRRMAAKERTKA